MVARCYSSKCNPVRVNSNQNVANKKGSEKNVPKSQALCPDCGNALFWGKPKKRQIRRNDPNPNSYVGSEYGNL